MEQLGGHPNTHSFGVVADRGSFLFPTWLQASPESCLHSWLLERNRAWPLSMGGFVIKAQIWLATLVLIVLWLKLTQEAPTNSRRATTGRLAMAKKREGAASQSQPPWGLQRQSSEWVSDHLILE